MKVNKWIMFKVAILQITVDLVTSLLKRKLLLILFSINLLIIQYILLLNILFAINTIIISIVLWSDLNL